MSAASLRRKEVESIPSRVAASPPPPPVEVISTDAIPPDRVAVTPAPIKLIVSAVPTEEPSS